MSDPRKEDDKVEIAAREASEPETITDAELDEANGGWNLNTSTFNTSIKFSTVQIDSANTVSGTSTEDVINSNDATFLRTRPGRIGNW